MQKLFFILIFFVAGSAISYAQRDDRAKARMERYQKELEKKQEEYINNFVNDLNVDAFQKEIITQRLHSYFEEKKLILTAEIESYKRKEILEELDRTHFLDLKDIVSKETMQKIDQVIKGEYESSDKKNKKKNKRKKKNKN